FAECRRAQILARIDAALRHLPLETRQDDLRSVIAETPADQDHAVGVEQGDPDIGAIGLLLRHSKLSRVGGVYIRRTTIPRDPVAYARVETVDPGSAIWTAVETEVDSDCAIEIAPVEKSTATVTDAVCVAEDVADSTPASEDTATLVAAAWLSEKVMYSVLPRWYSCAVVPAPRLLKVANSPLVPKRRSRKPAPSGPTIAIWKEPSLARPTAEIA